MRRLFTAALVAALILLFNPLSAGAINRERCAFQGLEEGWWSTEEVRRTIVCMANRFGVDPTTALSVAYRESRYDEWAWNDSSDAAGVFQHLYRYWPARADAYPVWQQRLRIRSDCWCNPRIQALVTMRMVQDSGWSAWGG